MDNNMSTYKRKPFIWIAIVAFAVSIFTSALFFMLINNGDKPEAKVSPHGFGPYPKLPDKWPKDYWDRPKTREQELIGRVRIKLYNEGKWADGITIEHDSGLVYPIYRDTIYIRWGTYTGFDGTQKRYISSARGHPDTMKRIKKYRFLGNISQLKDGVFPGDFSVSEQDLPSDINFLSYEEGAIDPMEYLGLE